MRDNWTSSMPMSQHLSRQSPRVSLNCLSTIHPVCLPHPTIAGSVLTLSPQLGASDTTLMCQLILRVKSAYPDNASSTRPCHSSSRSLRRRLALRQLSTHQRDHQTSAQQIRTRTSLGATTVMMISYSAMAKQSILPVTACHT